MREELLKWMKSTNDTALEALENHNSPAALKKFMAEQDARADSPQDAFRQKQTKKKNRNKRMS